MPSGARLVGRAEMQAKLRRISRQFPNIVMSALRIESEIDAKEVKRRTPVDRGHLRASVIVVGPLRDGNRIYALIAVGGPAAPYALFVHEDLTARHTTGQAKFLESVILESRPNMAARVAKRIELYRALAG